MPNLQLLIIDPQNDFCDPEGALYVRGADQDCVRLAKFLALHGHKFTHTHVTMDCHNEYDIAHPVFWKDGKGNEPNPLTSITRKVLEDGLYTVADTRDALWAEQYVKELEENGRYPLTIWPPHCIAGTEGFQIEKRVSDALRKLSKDHHKGINYIFKGENPYTEHYSAIKAEVPDPLDRNTLPNRFFLEVLNRADMLLVAGEALSHCVANTVRDIVYELGDDFAQKIYLLEDLCSNVPTLEFLGDGFVDEMTAKGMQVSDSVKVLA